MCVCVWCGVCVCARARVLVNICLLQPQGRGEAKEGAAVLPPTAAVERAGVDPPPPEERGTQVHWAANQGAGRVGRSKVTKPRIAMQAGVSPNGRHNVQIRLSLPPLGQGDSSRRPEGNRSRRQHVFRVTYCTVLAEWSTAFIAVGLLSFYLFAILDTKEQGQRDNINYKVGGSAPGSAPRRLHAPLASCPCTQRC
jgi:hypothetical protein